MLTQMAMKFEGVAESLAKYNLKSDYDHEHRDAEHEHEEVQEKAFWNELMQDGHSCPSHGHHARSQQRISCLDNRSTLRRCVVNILDMNVQTTGFPPRSDGAHYANGNTSTFTTSRC